MNAHDTLRNRIAEAARDLGFDARTEVHGASWPMSSELGRADIVIFDPLIVVEVKVDAAQHPACPPGWSSQLRRYTKVFGTWSQRWLVSDTFPRWHLDLVYGLHWRATTAPDFIARLERLAADGTDLGHVWKRTAA